MCVQSGYQIQTVKDLDCDCLPMPSMPFMRSVRGGFIFRKRRPSLKVHRGQFLTSIPDVD
jgi:hypothetical protein